MTSEELPGHSSSKLSNLLKRMNEALMQLDDKYVAEVIRNTSPRRTDGQQPSLSTNRKCKPWI